MSKWAATTRHKFLQLENRVLGVYNLHDCHNTARLVKPLIHRLKHTGQWRFYLDHVETLIPAVLDMQRRGIMVDREAKSRYRRGLRAELRETDEAISLHADSTGFTYTNKFPNSDAQVAKFLFKHLGLKAGKRTEKGRASVDQAALAMVLRNLRKMDAPHRSTLLNLFHRSRLQTIDERYLDFDVDPDSRVRPLVKMFGTKTMRFAYADPPLQQYPEEARHFFVASPGKAFVSADYSQLEPRLLAHFSNDEPSLAAFAAGEDIHWANARDLFGYTDADQDNMSPAKVDATRSWAKTGFLYRITYGGSVLGEDVKLKCPCPRCVDKVPPTLDLKRNEMLAAEQRWFAKHPAVLRFQQETGRAVQRDHYYESPLGGKRYIAAPWGRELDREIKNLPNQMGAARLMNMAQVRLYGRGAPIIFQHHDSFILEVPEREVDQWATLLREVMEEPVEALNDAVFPVDVSVGRNWGKWGELNPEGLKPA